MAIRCFTRTQPERIRIIYRVSLCEPIQVESSGQSDRVFLREPTHCWTVQADPVVPRLHPGLRDVREGPRDNALLAAFLLN